MRRCGMARDRAVVYTDIWADQDWRELSAGQQQLYMLMLTHGTLNYAGVMDWHAGRLAAMSEGRTASDVEADGAVLEQRRFILVDNDTGEGLVRSFLKHDGVLKQPKIVVSMTNAFASVASKKIRQVIAFEVQKLFRQQPDLRAWGVKQVQTILEFEGCPIDAVTPGLTHSVTPGVTPNADQAQGLPTTTATTTSTSLSNESDRGARSSRRKPESTLPDGWQPNDNARAFAIENGLDLEHEVAQFTNHAIANDRRLRDWDAGFRTWLGKSAQWSKQNRRQTPTERAQQTMQIGRQPLATDLDLEEIA